jgi:GAF domain-containing protein
MRAFAAQGVGPMTQDEALTTVSVALRSARSIPTLLELLTEKARELVGAHQATTSVVFGQDWAKAIHAVSLSDNYAGWRTYDERPDGSGIYRLVCQLNRPMRLTQAELEAHPAWRGFGTAAARHPPMRGWLAVPLTGRGGRNIGLIQLSDKYDGEFSAVDEAVLVELGRLTSMAFQETRRSARAQRRRGATLEHPRVITRIEGRGA